MTEKPYSHIAARVAEVQGRIALAAQKAGRKPEEITLIGVCKTQPAGAVRALIEAGVTHIAENRVQELLQKQPQLQDLRRTSHLIGNLQRNKAKYLPGHVDLLHSLDSTQIAAALEKAFAATDSMLDVLIQVNIGDESTKSGVLPGEVLPLAERVAASPILRLRGLMAIPPICEGEGARVYFEQMYRLFVDIQAKKMDNTTIDILSMGMSADYEQAILEGATMVRVGTALFGGRQYTV